MPKDASIARVTERMMRNHLNNIQADLSTANLFIYASKIILEEYASCPPKWWRLDERRKARFFKQRLAKNEHILRAEMQFRIPFEQGLAATERGDFSPTIRHMELSLEWLQKIALGYIYRPPVPWELQLAIAALKTILLELELEPPESASAHAE